MSNYFEGEAFDPRDPTDPTNEDDLCTDCREVLALCNRSVCADCLRDRMEDERLERIRQD